MQESSVLESVLRRDRLLVTTGLGIVMVLAWLYLLLGAGMDMTAGAMPRAALPGATAAMTMPGHDSAMAAQHGMGETMRMAHAAMMQPAVWTPAYAGLMLVMWWIMMIAMMLP